MPLTVRTPNHVDTSRSNSNGTVEHFFRGGESSKKSPSYSSPTSPTPTSPYLKHHDLEEDHGLYQKKSVLTKVKEKARKLRYSLSGKRRQDDDNVTPSWGVTLEDEEEDNDAEYLGAPMYESEVAPEVYKENARQHPRANPVICEKHVLQTHLKAGVEQQDQDHKPQSPVYTTTTTLASNTTRNEKVAEKLIPAYAEGSDNNDAANSISSKIEALAISRTPSANVSPQPSPSSASLTSSSSLLVNISPKGSGTSVKEYLKIKFEPGSDEKALSQVISEAMSPKKATTHNAGVMEKVRGAVNSLLGNEEPSQPPYAVKTTTASNSSQITNAQHVGHEGNPGRTLQAN